MSRCIRRLLLTAVFVSVMALAAMGVVSADDASEDLTKSVVGLESFDQSNIITAANYDAHATVNYATDYAYKACGCGKYYGTSPPPQGSGIQLTDYGGDCAHFVSHCLAAGGLSNKGSQYARGWCEGGTQDYIITVHEMRSWLTDTGIATKVSSVDQLEPGDIIITNGYSHVVLYIGTYEGKTHQVASHSAWGIFSYTYFGTPDEYWHIGTSTSDTLIPLSGNLGGTGDINGTFNSSTAEFTFNGKTVNFGTPTDLPVVGDWDGDGKDEIGVYRPDTGGSQSEFHLITRDWASLSNPVGAADKVIPFGYYPTNIPIAGDWDGDGDDDIGGFNPGNNKFYLYILNLGTSSAISYKDVPFGVGGDKPIIGDWDGDGDCDIGVYREYDPDYSSNLVFYFDLDLGGDQADLTPAPLGANGDVAVIGDWDNDGDDDVGLYRAEAFIIDPDLNIPHDLAYLDNGIVKVGVDLVWGGAISVLMHQGMNLIDNHDTGRLAQVAFYNDDSGTWDPVQGGDVFNQGSHVLEYNAEPNLIYTKTHSRDWKTGVLTDTHVEQWVSLEGKSVKVRYKFTHFGTDTYTFHDQEFPCAYINSRLYRLITYTDGAPWTDGGINEFSIPQTDPGTPNTEFYPTEYWASFVDDSDFGLTLYSPDHTPKWAAHRFTVDTKPSYLVTIDQFTIEPGTVEEATEYFIVGNYPAARSIVYSMGLNQLPTAIIDSITPDPAEQGIDTVSFTGHGTDSDGSIVAHNWRSSIDGQLSTSGSFSKPASDLSDGVHTIYYKVRDDNHSWSTEDAETLAIHLSGTDVITVDDDSPADYDNIQDAVDAAGMGDIIYVYNGTYNEHVIVSESLTLLGQNESNVIIDGGGSGNCVQISSSDVVINGFTITNASGYGIYASSSDLSIEHVTITGNGGYGIYFQSGKGFTLRDSTIDGNGGGIYGDGYATGDAVVEDNIITNNIGFGVLIHLAEGKSATVRNNNIDNNAGSSSDGISVHIAGTGGLMTIENNPVTKSGRYGIYLTGVRTGSTIANFTVQGSGSSGIYTVSSDVNIENVTITGNSGYGIYFQSGKGFTLRDSTIDGNGGGIYGDGYATGDAVVEDNIITNNIGFGVLIHLAEGKSATVRNNNIDNNAGSSSDGISVHIAGTGGLMTIENNPVTKSGRYGIYLTGVRTGSTIADFTVHESGSIGIYTVSSDVQIDNVTITDNGDYGIYFQSGKGFTLRDSTITGNHGGITYHGYATGDAVVEDNTITNNIGHGMAISLVEGKSATVRNNKIDNNAGGSSDGIYVYIQGTGGVMDIENNPVTKSGRYGIYLTGVRTGSTIADFTVHESGSIGIYTVSSDVQIDNVTITDNGDYGIYFQSGKGFTLRDSTITGNHGGITYHGYATGDAVVEDNTITNNIGHGMAISLVEGKSATVRNNKIDNNAGGSSDGIYVYIQGTGGVATIKNNLVENSGRYGIYLTGVTNSTVVENNISINCYGMRLYSSSNNSIFHNNFIDNINYNAQDNRDSNSWDDGYPSGGNYWGDDYPGTDADGDGIGDEPYDISGGAGAQDRYPLMQMWNITPPPDPIPAIDSDGDGVPDAWDDEPDTPAGYWTDSYGLGRRWGDMNGDGKLTSADALMILQAAAGTIDL